MHDASWIALFRRIPANLHEGLVLTLTTGAELVVQSIVKLDTEVVILRGRVAGTHEGGRVILLPYTQLLAVNFTRRLTQTDVTTIFGKNTQSFAADVVLTPAIQDDGTEPKADEAAKETAAQTTPTPGAPGPLSSGKMALPTKAELLAKLRARIADPSRSEPSRSERSDASRRG